MSDSVNLSHPSPADMPGSRTDRVFGQAYKPSATRPSRVTVRYSMIVNLAQSADLVFMTSLDEGSTWTTEQERKLGLEGTLNTLLAVVLNVTITDFHYFHAFLPANAMWKVVSTLVGSPTVALISTREVVL